LEYHILLARDLGYLPESRYDELAKQTVEVRRMLTALIQRVDAARVSADHWKTNSDRHDS
jgi:hypothetical protein